MSRRTLPSLLECPNCKQKVTLRGTFYTWKSASDAPAWGNKRFMRCRAAPTSASMGYIHIVTKDGGKEAHGLAIIKAGKVP